MQGYNFKFIYSEFTIFKLTKTFAAILFFSGIYSTLFGFSYDKSTILANSLSSYSRGNSDSNYVTSNQYKIDILKYDISIDINSSKKSINGITTILGRITDSTLTSIDLNLTGPMYIDSLSVDNKPAKYLRDETSLFIKIEKGRKDTFVVYIKYHGKPQSLGYGSFVFGQVYGKEIVYTLNEPNNASTWLPCNDIPSDKALVTMHIKADSANISVSNGRLINVVSEGDKNISTWSSNYPISTYLICLYSAPYTHFSQEYLSKSGKTMPIDYYVLPEHLQKAQKDFNEHPKMLSFFSDLFGEYPFIEDKYGVAEFLWNAGAMEHQTITGIGQTLVTGNGRNEDFLVHELAHHWWGDAIGPASWDDIWLNEGFATYSEALYLEKFKGKKEYDEKMSYIKDDFQWHTLYKPADKFGSIVYNKGAWVLHMLRNEIGDSAFFSTLRVYYDKFKYNNASTAQFINIAESISGHNLQQFFQQWVYSGKGIIEIDTNYIITKQGKKSIVKLKIAQKQEGYGCYDFPLEVNFYDKFGILYETKVIRVNKQEETFSFNLDYIPARVVLDRGNKLLIKVVNSNKTGSIL